MNETSELILLSHSNQQQKFDAYNSNHHLKKLKVFLSILGLGAIGSAILVSVLWYYVDNVQIKDMDYNASLKMAYPAVKKVIQQKDYFAEERYPMEGKQNEHINKKASSLVKRRCDWVVNLFTQKYDDKTDEELTIQYAVQSQDPNVFYRATANIFWIDYVKGGWGDLLQFKTIGIDAVHSDGTPLQPYSTWTWITGDQHLSNFGAWRNRHHDVVFSVNDFDEAAIYDFRVDVFRIAVSVCSHAYTNGFDKKEVRQIIMAFTDTYVETLINYVGGDRELLYEITPDTATGSLKSFLEDLRDGATFRAQMKKFTVLDENDNRRFLHNEKTRLIPADPEIEEEIRKQITPYKYGATMMQVGWHVRDWDDDFFEVLDIAARIRTGVGSYGVDRYYVLLKGTDGSLQDDGNDGNAVILDIKFEPAGAVSNVLTPILAAKYDVIFNNDAERAVLGQRALTSYVDPFTGWIFLNNTIPFVVHQRSPWKQSFDLESLTEFHDILNFMEQIAIATATSHARGTAAKSPGQFKHVIASVLRHWADRKKWGQAFADVAHHYHHQVLKDFECFTEFVDSNYT